MSLEESDSAGMQRMKERLNLDPIRTDEIRLKGMNFKPRAEDVFIATPPKCGTTWMQQIVHQLRSGGDMSYNNISDIIPCIEMGIEIDLDAEHRYQPRCYKTHLWYPDCPKGGKYIVVYREPCAAFYSFFNFFKGWFFQPGEVTLHEFVTRFLLKRGVPKDYMENASYCVHLTSWWEHRHDKNVLFLFFEDMKDDLEGVVREVASFIGIKDEERIKKAVEMSSFEYMKGHSDQFSCREARYNREALGLSNDTQIKLLVKGSVTQGKEMMDDETKAAIQARWLEVVGKQTGLEDYDEFRNTFKKEKKNRI